MSANPESENPTLEKAHQVLPGGTFGNTGAEMIIREGRGSRVWDENGNEFVDYLIGSGPMLVGHNHPDVTAAVREQLERGTTFFANNPQGIDLAEAVIDAVPCADKVRFACTGSEADAFAMRLARAYTGRDKILKFEGGYHGYSDYGLMSMTPARPRNDSEPQPDSAGIPSNVGENIVVAPYNDADAVESLIREHEGTVAAIMLEPFQRIIPPQPGFLDAMRRLATDNDMLLIFDEVVTGFRLAYGGAQEYYDVVPDICTLGKAVGGGFPLSAVAGRDEVMAMFDKSRADDRYVPMTGTLSGNPVAAAAGLATLEILKRPDTYERLFAVGRTLMNGLAERVANSGIEAQVIGEPPLFDVVFAGGEMRNYRDTHRGDSERLKQFNALLRERGILKGESKYYISLSLTDADVQQTLDAWEDALGVMATH
ncbi:MAG: aspartate aminotransferase family protein [Alphaproteobacteria bacterium]|nr:aspartate aminotransferase family protein [Alphaproteobacteria bacterium]